MEIQIQQMDLRNFKGIRSLNVNFNNITDIKGDNATGKTTIFDAFTWLLFGKNSSDAKDFNIKTLDEFNQPIHKLDHEVSAIILVDGKPITLKRVFREKWVKKRGAEISEFTGHETEFFIDDVPLSQNEYKSRIDFMIKEELAKLLTNPLYFNQLKWPDRRTVLESMAGAVSDAEILSKITTDQNTSFILALTNELNRGKKMVDYKKEINAKKKLIKETLDVIPTRIDEAERSKPEPQNYDAIEKEIGEKQLQVVGIELDMDNKSKSYQKKFEIIQGDHLKLSNLKLELMRLQNEVKNKKTLRRSEVHSKIVSINQEIAMADHKIKGWNEEITRHEKFIQDLETENNSLRDKWNLENARKFELSDDDIQCPTCKQLLPDDQKQNRVNDFTANFNANKSKNLKQLNDAGQNNKIKIEKFKEHIQELSTLAKNSEISIQNSQAEKTALQKEAEEIDLDDSPVIETPEMIQLQKQISEFIIEEIPPVDNTAARALRDTINQEIDALKKLHSNKDQITRIKNRIIELEAEEKKLSQELADLERIEFAIDAFNKEKIETIESRINNKFKLVKFKMFEIQINGGEAECCECMVNGVPYNDINTAGKINAGIDIINALTDHYKIHAPVWIDNRESTIRILPCKSQIINLIATKDLPLTILSSN